MMVRNGQRTYQRHPSSFVEPATRESIHDLLSALRVVVGVKVEHAMMFVVMITSVAMFMSMGMVMPV
jgi:hypothetical protein